MNILCPDPYKAGIVAKNKELFYKAAHKMMDHRRHHGRAEGAKMVINVPIEEFYIVADKVMHIVKDQDLTYHSYHGMGPKIAAISVLANLNVREGIEEALAALDSKVGKFGFKVRMLMNVLPRYGSTAKEYYPKFKDLVKDGKFKRRWDNMIKKIESDTKPRKMMSFEEAKQLSANLQ